MARAALVAVAFSLIVRLIRFGYSAGVWQFALFAAMLILLIAFGDRFGLFDRTTGWFRGMYVDEPTPPLILKGLVFLALLVCCVLNAVYRDFA